MILERIGENTGELRNLEGNGDFCKLLLKPEDGKENSPEVKK